VTEQAATSSYRVLVIIPVYNHHEKMAEILQRVNDFHLPCLVLDDGSTAQTQQALAQCVAASPENTLIRYEQNRGKGAVVCDGLLWAQQHGYTHALQVDADGQHDLDDIPAFLAASRAHPDAVISGYRDYRSMPPQRRYGRRVTDIWVAIHTWSCDLRDSMCGYRLYPVAPAVALIREVCLGARMDFDTDIAVRLYWRGLDMRHVETAIHYRDDITSHFDLWNDNLRISVMHTRLFFGMLWRMPVLRYRQMKKQICP